MTTSGRFWLWAWGLWYRALDVFDAIFPGGQRGDD